MMGTPAITRVRVERLRTRFSSHVRGMDYVHAEGDVRALLDAHDHYKADAEELRDEKERIWSRVNRQERRTLALRIAEWSLTLVLWGWSMIAWHRYIHGW